MVYTLEEEGEEEEEEEDTTTLCIFNKVLLSHREIESSLTSISELSDQLSEVLNYYIC
jgi:hypothetical protein